MGKLTLTSGLTVSSFALFLVVLFYVSLQEHEAAGVPVVRPSRQLSRSLLSNEETAKRIRDSKAQVPRYNFNGDKVSSDFNPSNSDYQQSIIVLAAVCVLVGVLALLYGICFTVCRCCCGCCGGRQKTEGCCCPDKDSPRVYTTCERWWVKIAMFIVAGCVFGMASMGYAGNVGFSKGVDNMLVTLIDIADKVVADVTTVDTLFRSSSIKGQMLYQTATQDAVTALDKALKDVKSSINDVRGTVRDVNDVREYALNIVFGWCMAVVCVGVLGALCSWGWPACLLTFFGFLTLFFIWIMVGFIFPISVVMGDFCRAVNEYLKDRRACEQANVVREQNLLATVDCTAAEYSPTGKQLNDIVKCVGKDQRTMLSTGAWGGMAGVLAFRNTVVTTLPQLPADRNKNAPTPNTIRRMLKDSGYATWQSVGKYRVTDSDPTTRVDGNGAGSYEVIATKRTDLIAQINTYNSGQTSNFTNLIDAYSGYLSLYSTVDYLTGCLYVIDAFDRINEKLCIDTLQSLDLIAAGFMSIGFLYMFAVWFAILGMKRFPKQELETMVGAKPLRPLPMREMSMA